MDPRLEHAAESGSIDELYALIDENPYILANIDAVPFINTPLHVAAAAGKLEFAMEMLHLKPSLARKLNTSGYSPLHLAVDKGHTDFVSWMLKHDHSLACVKGRNGMTPFHVLVVRGRNVDLVAECLLVSPECILDMSVNGQTALHLAVVNDRFEALQVLTGWIQRTSQRNAFTTEKGFLNKTDFSHNTALHLAAYKNDLQAVRLLLECRLVERNKVNGDGLTFLDILRNLQSHCDLDLEKVILKTRCKEAASIPKPKAVSEFLKSPLNLATYSSTITNRLRSNTSEEARGAFLIVFTLIITATFQTALQPPGGGGQSKDPRIKRAFFILLWFFNTAGFNCALFNTFCLLPLRRLFTSWFISVGLAIGVSYALAVAANSPDPVFFFVMTTVIVLVYVLYLLLLAFLGRRQHRTVASEPNLSWFRRS
ncbi:unnamed protein product [Eruca vesicaria subsp. sativa]|uniref:PGG domain-containing protein n=1 Tax=Eruca vesicaria subsp. sativa TaxID=29727 RepID=A0ABC8LFD9_ERUVS|nr:unnamed protein product [Eruca vesicaria subsp. sativa]